MGLQEDEVFQSKEELFTGKQKDDRDATAVLLGGRKKRGGKQLKKTMGWKKDADDADGVAGDGTVRGRRVRDGGGVRVGARGDEVEPLGRRVRGKRVVLGDMAVAWG